MVKLKIARVAAASVASAGLIAGFSGAAFAYNGGGDNSHHHDHGSNSVVLTNTKTVSKNNVNVNNSLDQNAQTGDALSLNLGSSHHHDHGNKGYSSSTNNMGGDAMTGDATNTASFVVNGTVTNNGSAPKVVAPTTTSSNHGNSFTMTNTKTVSVNNVNVNNHVTQNAQSGDAASIGGNGGSATTGDASNTSYASVTLDVSN